MSKNTLITFAGTLWIAVGLFMIYKGTTLYQLAIVEQQSTQAAVLTSLLAGLIIGSVKGNFVLTRTARRNKSRIEGLHIPLKIHHTYSKPFYGLIAGMILLGFLLRSLNHYIGGYVIVGAIYWAVGLALIIGSRAYWQSKPKIILEENS